MSRITVRQAIDALAREGILRRVPGSGTFVNASLSRSLRIGLAVFGFAEASYRHRPEVFGELVSGITLGAEGSRLFLHVVYFPADAEPVPALREALQAAPLDGILVRTFLDLSAVQAAAIDALGVPWVLVKRSVPDLPVHCVVSDDTAGTERAIQHLLDLGHRQIGLVLGPPHISIFRQRREGYERALQRAGLEVDQGLICKCANTLEADGRLATERLLAHARPPTAIFVASDLMAIGIYDVLAAHGLRIPEDCSVIGYDGLAFGERLRPSLTTIRTAYAQFGAEAIRLLLRVLAGEISQPERVEVEAELIVRASTGPSARGATIRSERRRRAYAELTS